MRVKAFFVTKDGETCTFIAEFASKFFYEMFESELEKQAEEQDCVLVNDMFWIYEYLRDYPWRQGLPHRGL